MPAFLEAYQHSHLVPLPVHYCIVDGRTIVLGHRHRLAVDIVVQHLLAGRRGLHALHTYGTASVSILGFLIGE